ncbi:hypothetical protein LHGZ1_1566 [Laribacter hongkongensis]|uniref:Uncharacterized protein n=1 Tax=Laribacter hongkongensis TaxID=168471 RepID=A0A248LI18_9NEIS|nr:hypothetical protein LHGZ1_1566 [Laribacter hongkongensis]
MRTVPFTAGQAAQKQRANDSVLCRPFTAGQAAKSDSAIWWTWSDIALKASLITMTLSPGRTRHQQHESILCHLV